MKIFPSEKGLITPKLKSNISEQSELPQMKTSSGVTNCCMPAVSANYFHPSFGNNSLILTNISDRLVAKAGALKNKLGEKIFTDAQLLKLRNVIKLENGPAISVMLSLKNGFGSSLLDSDWIINLASAIKDSHQANITSKLLIYKKSPDLIIGTNDIISHLCDVNSKFYAGITKGIGENKVNVDFYRNQLSMLLGQKASNGTERFGSLGIYDILRECHSEAKLNHLRILLQNQDLETFDIIKCLVDRTLPSMQKPMAAIYDFDDFAKLGLNFNEAGVLNKKEQIFLCHSMNKNPERAQRVIQIFSNPEAAKANLNLNGMNANKFISNSIMSDVERFIINKEPYVKEFAQGAPVETIKNLAQAGDVVKIGEKLFVKDEGELSELKITKEKFEELFPPVKRFNLIQKGIGDCWLISALDTVMDNPNARAKVFKLFRQEGNDLYIKFPNGTNEIKFTNSKILDSEKGLEGAKGLQMIEQAFSIHRMDEYKAQAFEDMLAVVDVDAQLDKLAHGHTKELYKALFGMDKIREVVGCSLVDKYKYKTCIEAYANNENCLMTFAMHSPYNRENVFANSAYDLFRDHAYAIKGYNKETGKVYISNPHNAGLITEVPIYELMKHLRQMTVVKLTL